jgi:hypothetical protein
MVRLAESFSFYPVNTKFSILGALLMITCSIAMQGEILKSLF